MGRVGVALAHVGLSKKCSLDEGPCKGRRLWLRRLSRRFRDWQILRAPPPPKDGAFFESSHGTRNPRLGPALSAIANRALCRAGFAPSVKKAPGVGRGLQGRNVPGWD
jgi:hypothetical protein